MAQQIINNGETGGVVRGKLNGNFAELYSGIVNPYPRVANYAALPDATTVTNLIYVVETATGIWPFRRPAGMWLSNGVAWSWLANETLIAEQVVFTPSGLITSTNVQAAILEAATTSLSGSATITITRQDGAFEWEETVAATGVTPSSKIMLSLAATTNDDENTPELLDINVLAGVPGTNQITVTASFITPNSGPIKLNWSAF